MIKTLKQTIKNLYYWIKKKLIQFKKWLIILICGATILAAPIIIPSVPDIALEKIQADYNASELKDKYRLEKTAFILDAVDENAIQAEVGNKNSDSFEPSLTLRKWSDEVNFKVKYKHSEKEKDQKVDIEDKKIKWKGEKTEVHYYEMKKGELLHDKVLEHDVFEVEVILLEKPDTNIVEFDIETKGLAFYYQPELTQEEKDEGAFRPENVIGSYAVYHESKQGDYSQMGLKNYRAGIAFHIYRPKIIDSAGIEIWGELNITDNLLTVTIPQEFLDNAVYPVRHAAGLTFGYETLGSSGKVIAQDDFIGMHYVARTSNVYAASAGTVDKITVGLKSSASLNSDTMVFINKKDSGGANSHGEIVSIERSNLALTSSYSWYDFTASSESLSADDYLLSVIANPYDFTGSKWVAVAYNNTSSQDFYGESWAGTTTEYVDGQESPWVATVNTATDQWSIYCTYTSSGAEARRMFLTQ